VPVFDELSDALAREGYAVLRYDKRTCGKFNGCADNAHPLPSADITIDVLIDDAAAALAWLGARPEVDPKRLVVVGHSQGAVFVPALAHRVDGLVAGVMLAPTHQPIDAVIAQQLADSKALLAKLGAPGADAIVAPLQQAVDGLAMIRAGTSTEAVMGTPAAFWTSWLAQTDAAPGLAVTSPVPLLVLGGTMDTNVPPSELARWRTTLDGSQHEVVVLDRISHAMTRIEADTVEAVTPASLGRHVDPAVTSAVNTFIASSMKL
jgi:dienelactone hydrolase